MKKIFFLLLCSFFSLAGMGQNNSWQELPATGEPEARHENALVAVGNKILLIGGRGEKPIDIYDASTQTWSQGAQPPFEVHHLQAVELDGLVYALGGFTGSWPHETPLSHVLIYDITENFWAIGPEIPKHRRRGAAGVVAHNSKIYLINGIINGHTSGWVNWLDEFDPYTNTWRELPNAPQARDHFQATVIDNKIYVAGGRRSGSGDNGFAGTLKEAYAFDLNTNSWESLPPIPTERAGTAAIEFDGKYVVIGGESEDQEASHAEVESYDPELESWQSLPVLKQGRHGTQAVVMKDVLITGAGSGNQGGGPELTSFEMFTAEEGEQSDLSELKPIEKASLTTSAEFLNLSQAENGNIQLKNPSANKAIFISYLQLDNTTSFELEIMQSMDRPLILAPGAEKELLVRSKGTNAKDPSAILLIKSLGNSEPLQIKISN